MRLAALMLLISQLAVACFPEVSVSVTPESDFPAERSELISQSISYGDPEEQARFVNALDQSGIPYSTGLKDGNDFITWDGDYSEQVNEIRERLFGPDLPDGRSIAFEGEFQDRFKSWLSENGIPFETVTKRGIEYIVWEESSSERVKAWEYFPAYPDQAP